MAAIDQPAPQSGKKPRARKHNFRLDMTPMVDLAFLLLTFFMLTTTFARPRVMQLTMPVKDQERTHVREHDAMTIMLGRRHQVYYYFGLNQPDDPTVPTPTLYTTNFQSEGIRKVLLAQRQQRALIVLIKPGPGATYRDMVDILDEMNITDQRQYALVDLAPADQQLLPATERQ